MKKFCIAVFFSVFIAATILSETLFADNDPRNFFRMQTSISFIPAGNFVTSTGFQDATPYKRNDPTGLGLGLIQAFLFRPHQNFSFGISTTIALFFEESEFTRSIDQHLARISGGVVLPFFIDVILPLKTHIQIAKNLEFQIFCETGLKILIMPSSETKGIGPLLIPGFGIEYNFDQESRSGFSLHLDLAYSMSWMNLESRRFIGGNTPIYEAKISYMSYVETRFGLSYNL
jgi:hypothetical protein